MLYLTWICGFWLLLILFVFAVIMRKRLSRQMLLGICIASFAVSVFFPMRYVLCNPILKESVSVTTLKEKNDASQAWDVIVDYIDTNYSERKIENPIEGKWAWWDGDYVWFDAWESMGVEPTDTVVFELPVGNERAVVFKTTPRSGMAEISCMGITRQVDLFSEEWENLSVKLPPSENGVYRKDILLRGLAFAGLSVLTLLTVAAAAIVLNRMINWRSLLKWKYEALVFFVSLINVVLLGRYPDVYGYSVTYYFLPYERGFGSRGLTGTLTSLLVGPYVGLKGLKAYILGILILLYFFGSILIVKLAKKESDWRMGVFWMAFYLMTPFTFMQIYDDARPDIYLIILFVIGVISIYRKRFIQLIPALCVVMILFNETSSLFFVAPLLALLLYCAVTERDAGYFISFFSSAAFTCVTTLGILRLDAEKLVPIGSFFAHMAMHTDAPLDYNAFKAEYKTSNSLVNDFANWMGNQYFANHELLIESILFFILVIPFVILLAILWKAVYYALLENEVFKAMTNQSGSGCASVRLKKFLFWIMLLSSCGSVVCMLMAFDYLRFTMFIMVAATAIMFVVIRKEKLTLQIGDLYLFKPPKREIPILPFAILIYMDSWGMVAMWGPYTVLLEKLAQILRDFAGIK